MKTKVGKWLVDEQTRTIIAGEERIELNLASFKLLQLFISCPKEVIPLSKIKEQVWQTEFTTDNLVYQTIRGLRKALEGEDAQSYIKTVPRHGYQLSVKIEKISETPASGEKTAELPATGRAQENKAQKRLFFTTGLFSNIMMIMVIIIFFAMLWLTNITPQQAIDKPADNTNNGHLLVISPGAGISERQNQAFMRYSQSIKEDLKLSEESTSNTVNLLSKLARSGKENKLVVQYMPQRNAVLNLVFTGHASRLVHLSITSLDKTLFEQKRAQPYQQMLDIFNEPNIKYEKTGITGLLTEVKEIKALLSLTYSPPARLHSAQYTIRQSIEKNSLNEQQKQAKYYFIEALYAFYKIEHYNAQRLYKGVNYLLKNYSQSNFSVVAAALYLAHIGNTQLAYQLLENQQQDSFVQAIKGMLHLKLGETYLALNHFEAVYKMDKAFEDNAAYYIWLLKKYKQNAKLERIYSDLAQSDYIGNDLYDMLFSWLLSKGSFSEAIDFIARYDTVMGCSDGLYSAMALLNNSLINHEKAMLWQSRATAVNNRNRHIPWLVYVRALYNNDLASYLSWYQSYIKDVIGQESRMHSLIITLMAHLVLGEYEQANKLLTTLEKVKINLFDPAVVAIIKALIQSHIAKQQNQAIDDVIAEIEPQVRAFTLLQGSLIRQVLASYFMLSRDFDEAEVHLLEACKANPALCLGWQHISLFKPVIQTDKLQAAIKQANKAIKGNQGKLIQLNRQVAQLCPVAKQ
ncbi:winged helix-turn-helix domain-containing protein [Thalassomonas actiniarum]|uniref:Winged helix-turn-helix transcriptional regulator n=1 Tax=Thalassomonas actiniarum TaxID=485447 RepID=A0AAE9YZB9_9GAMM|nr:winged helix-turn-helix domain-containing protein [Thalassomonas actiniarum]WDE02303.1 winged helix-turn-helix transcriptional regulator [Thalassomonas actiniarum]